MEERVSAAHSVRSEVSFTTAHFSYFPLHCGFFILLLLLNYRIVTMATPVDGRPKTRTSAVRKLLLYFSFLSLTVRFGGCFCFFFYLGLWKKPLISIWAD